MNGNQLFLLLDIYHGNFSSERHSKHVFKDIAYLQDQELIACWEELQLTEKGLALIGAVFKVVRL